MARLLLKAGGESAVVPAKFAGSLREESPVRVFAGRDLTRRDRIFNHLRSGGIAVLRGDEAALDELSAYVKRKGSDTKPRSNSVLGRLMVAAKNGSCDGINPPVRIPYLSEFCGEAVMPEDQLFLIPLAALRDLQNALEQKWQVRALDTWLLAGKDVILPRSQETVELFQEAIATGKLHLPDAARILDMGCGSGVLTLVAAVALKNLKPKIVATDILPEAIASTRLNVGRFVSEGLVASDTVEVRKAGDLFEPVRDERFDLIILNAPWVVAPVGSRADISLNDPKQKMISRFFDDFRQYLNRKGRVVLGYADNSGQRAVSRVLEMADGAGLSVLEERSVRIQTRRKKRKWQRLYVWELGL